MTKTVKESEFVSALPPQEQAGEGEIPSGLNLGRLVSEDTRDQRFPMSAMLRSAPARTRPARYWNQSQWWGDQGNMPHCVAFAWMHWLEDGPITHRALPAPMILPRELYCQSQQVDEWYGDCSNPRYDGTSVRAGAKVLQGMGLIRSYGWAWDVDTMVQALLTRGPVVVGTWWYESMFHPGKNGFVNIAGRRVGGHAYLANGVNVKRRVIRFKNSWGRTWGKSGNFWMTFDDTARLIREQGEVCLAEEVSADDPDQAQAA